MNKINRCVIFAILTFIILSSGCIFKNEIQKKNYIGYYLYGEIHCSNNTSYKIDLPIFQGYDGQIYTGRTSLVTAGLGSSTIKESSYGKVVEITGKGNLVFFTGYMANGTDYSFTTVENGNAWIYSNTSDVKVILESAGNLGAFQGYDYSAIYNGKLPLWHNDKSAFIGFKYYGHFNETSFDDFDDFERTENSTISLSLGWNSYEVRYGHWIEYSRRRQLS